VKTINPLPNQYALRHVTVAPTLSDHTESFDMSVALPRAMECV
jgi:hypothetical protein